jgi:histidine triad (HIT) family protein
VDCLFCRIVAGELPAAVVWRDERVMAFLDIAPAAPGHTLVVPVRHADDLYGLAPEDAPALWSAIQTVGRALGRRYRASGLNLLSASGAAAGQTVGHLHVHLIPRSPGDGLGLHVPAGQAVSEPDLLAREAESIRACLTP